MFSRSVLHNGILLYDVPDENYHPAMHFDLSSTNPVTFQKYITEVNFKRGD